jgi:hypothetical protein
LLNLVDPAFGSQIRQGESFRHARQIIKPYGELDKILAWCRSQLSDEWRWQLLEMSSETRPGRYIFYFDSERDYVAFLLHWS